MTDQHHPEDGRGQLCGDQCVLIISGMTAGVHGGDTRSHAVEMRSKAGDTQTFFFFSAATQQDQTQVC